MSLSPFQTRTPPPAKPRVKINLVGDELVLRCKQRGLGVAAFLLLWMAGWSAGCGLMLHQLVTDFEWFMMLFSIPFFAAWVAVAALLLFLLFGTEQLVIGRDELRCTSRALVTYKRRTIPLDEVELAAADKVTDTNSEGPPTVHGIVTITTLGQPVQFAKGISDPEAEWLAETINVCLDRLAPHRAALAATEANHETVDDHEPIGAVAESFDTVDDSFTDGVLEFQPSRERWERPSDSHWRMERNRRATEFTCRGAWSVSGIAGLAFFNLFWNGVVSVFVYQLVEDFQWFLALFLTPFVGMGLVLFAAWLYTLTAPLWGIRYSIRFGQVTRQQWGPVYRTTREWEFQELDRVEISKPGFNKNQIDFPPERFTHGDYRLRLIDVDDHTVAKIDSLTKGEAFWMADVVMNEHPDMFRRDR